MYVLLIMYACLKHSIFHYFNSRIYNSIISPFFVHIPTYFFSIYVTSMYDQSMMSNFILSNTKNMCSNKEDNFKCEVCGGKMKLLRHVSFVDCPGHDILMATMLNGAAGILRLIVTIRILFFNMCNI
jgi:hypothetical protein